MKTYIAEIIPRLEKFSKKLDDLTKLTNQHWVSLGDITDAKKVFMFRANSKLLIAENGIIIDRGTWEYLGNQSLLLETSNGGYLLKHGFFDENVIALKLDSSEKYAFFINETKFGNELNTLSDIIIFLENKYLRPHNTNKSEPVGQERPTRDLPKGTSASYETEHGLLTLTGEYITHEKKIIKATINGRPAPDRRYKLAFMWYVRVKNGIVI